MKMKSSAPSVPKFSTSLRRPLGLDQVRTVPYLPPPQLECALLWIDEARILQPGRSHERPVTLNQVIGIFPRLEPGAVDQVAQFLERRAWRVLRAPATLEDVMLYLKREKRASDAGMHYARKRLGLEQDSTKSLQPH